MVRGIVTFETQDTISSGLRVLISVLDTSRIGADSRTVAETVLTIPEGFDAGHDGLPFEIDAQVPADTCTIRAHLPKHDGTDVRLGDMITTGSIPVIGDTSAQVVLHTVT